MVDFLEVFYNQQELMKEILRAAGKGEHAKAEMPTRALQRDPEIWRGLDKWERARSCGFLIARSRRFSGVELGPELNTNRLERSRRLAVIRRISPRSTDLEGMLDTNSPSSIRPRRIGGRRPHWPSRRRTIRRSRLLQKITHGC